MKRPGTNTLPHTMPMAGQSILFERNGIRKKIRHYLEEKTIMKKGLMDKERKVVAAIDMKDKAS